MVQLRALVAVCLALVLFGTSGAMAVARGQMAADPGQTIVICIGANTEILRVDADGNPIAPNHVCPDCALSGFAGTHGHDAPAVALRAAMDGAGPSAAQCLNARAVCNKGAPRAPPRLT